MSNNQTIDIHVEELFSSTVQIFLFLTYGTICLLAVCINSIVVYLYNTRKIQSSSFNLCLVHLSGMNIAQSIGIIPFVYIDIRTLEKQSTYEDSLKCGIIDGMCSFFAFAFGCVWCITFMSISRLAIIRRPLSRHMQKPTINKILTSFWVFGIVGLIPNMFSWRLDIDHGYCQRVQLLGHKAGLLYPVFLFVIGLILPILAQSVTYIMIIYQLYKRKCMKVNRSSIKYRKHIIILLGILICINILCWAPFGIYWLLSSLNFFGKDIKAEYEKTRITHYVMIPCVAAGVLNPICYALTGTEFRKGLQKTFPLKNFKSRKIKQRVTSMHLRSRVLDISQLKEDSKNTYKNNLTQNNTKTTVII